MDLIRIVVAILLPPLGVFLQVGFGGQFWLNILLTLLRLHTGYCACCVDHRKKVSYLLLNGDLLKTTSLSNFSTQNIV